MGYPMPPQHTEIAFIEKLAIADLHGIVLAARQAAEEVVQPPEEGAVIHNGPGEGTELEDDRPQLSAQTGYQRANSGL
ncbi:unnamed protein product, partial [marine sediment metagenome]